MIYNNKSFMSKPGVVSCCLTLTCFLIAAVLGVLYIHYNDSKFHHHYGEGALFMLGISFLSWLISLEIRKENKNKNTKVTPV